MLAELYIENVAVIQRASIALGPGFNVFTGETGAGKTILISAIDAVLGERTSREIIRAGEQRAMVSALFEELPGHVLTKLRELGYEDDEGSLLITREITAAGKTSVKIGGMPATTAILREIASLLIHIHGQRDSGQLLLPERHMRLIDDFGELWGERSAYREAYSRMRELRAELDAIQTDERQKAQRIDMLSFQVGEIEAARLEDGEEAELTERRAVIRNSEKIREGLAEAYEAFSGGESDGVDSLLDRMRGGIETAAAFVSQFATAAERLREIGYELGEIGAEIRDYLDEFEYDPRELDQLEGRLDMIYKLKRKYGIDIPAILDFYEDAKAELESLETSGERAAKLGGELKLAEAKAGKLAAGLTAKRKKAAKEFAAKVEEELAFLDMPSVRLSVEQRAVALSRDGADEMELFIVTNVGEEPKPLSKIASGGEIARIMLAVKNVLAERDRIPSLIFDEVDTGVSGRAAQKIGRKLSEVSGARQVIAVTHLAQVAAFADSHYLIAKEVEEGRTHTKVTALGKAEAIAELARITSGDQITPIALQNAEELWTKAHAN